MNPFIILVLAIMFVTGVEAKTQVSVTSFRNKSSQSNCRYIWYWSRDLGDAFKEMLITKLMEHPELDILEREHIKDIYSDEHELVNSENERKPTKGKFKVADITLIGAVTEYEFCQSKVGGSVDVGRLAGFGSMNVGVHGANAGVGVDIRVVNVETGQILGSAIGHGKSSSTQFDLDSYTHGFDFQAYQNSPLGKATRDAIEEAAEKVLKLIPKKT